MKIKKNIKFDYIFFASGTGTTQAGLVCGQYLNKDFSKKIVGISIARSEEKGRKIIIDSIKEYLNKDENNFENLVEFVDKYTSDGYGKKQPRNIKGDKKCFIQQWNSFEFNVYRKSILWNVRLYQKKEY